MVSRISSIADSTTKFDIPLIGRSLTVWPRQSPIVSYGAVTYGKEREGYRGVEGERDSGVDGWEGSGVCVSCGNNG